MLKILHTARYTGVPLKILEESCPEGFVVKTLDVLSYDQLKKEAVDADYFIVSGRLPIDKGIVDSAKKLKMIQRTGVGTEMLDLPLLHSLGIPVYVNAGVNSRSVAEHTISLILSCLKRIPQINAEVHSGIWKKQASGLTTHELYAKTVGLVGMGNIGRMVASYLKAFGARVLYTDVVRQRAEVEGELGISFRDSFEDLLPESDILSFHCPLTPQNEGMLNKKALSLMKDGSIVVNTARGKLIDPDALYDALKSGKLASAALDTHSEEPIKEDYRLLGLGNVILTPHIGGLSYEAFHHMMQDAMRNIKAFEEGRLDDIEPMRLK